MPGECHAHLFMNGQDYKRAVKEHEAGADPRLIRRYLCAYREQHITFVRDGGDRFGVSALAKKLAPEYGIDYRSPIYAICRKKHYGRIVGRAVEDLKEYAEAVSEVKKLGGDFVKIMVSGIMDYDCYGMLSEEPLCGEWIHSMIKIAHDEGMSVMVHGNGKRAVLAAILAGADSIEHGNYMDKECLTAMAQAKCVWVPTIVTTRNIIGCGRYRDDLLKQIYRMECDNLKEGYRLGVKLAVGSDAGAYLVPHGRGAHQELACICQALEEAGYEEEEILRHLKMGEAQIKEKFKR